MIPNFQNLSAAACMLAGRLQTRISGASEPARAVQQLKAKLLDSWSLLHLGQAKSYSGNASELPPAFVFDIDGVLVRGKIPLAAAQEAMQKLVWPSTAGSTLSWRYPVVFLTNGGGMTEEAKAAQLTQWLGVPVTADQVVLSHSPMRSLVPHLKDAPVLISGRGDVLNVARSYGFQRVLSTAQLGAVYPSAIPFTSYSGGSSPAAAAAAVAPVSQSAPDRSSVSSSNDSPGTAVNMASGGIDTTQAGSSSTPPGHRCPVRDDGLATLAAPVQAILVMTDPRDWYRDMQLIIDTVTGHGVPTRPAEECTGPNPVQVYFSNTDLLWANDFPKNRFGQGAFLHIVASLYKHMTSQPLPHLKVYGKPHREPYELAQQLLIAQAQRMGLVPQAYADRSIAGSVSSGSSSSCELGSPSLRQHSQQQQVSLPFSGIYAVGDNPVADVRGARSMGRPWVPLLVRTGVFRGLANCHVDPADFVVDDVLGAVTAVLHRARSAKWHAIR